MKNIRRIVLSVLTLLIITSITTFSVIAKTNTGYEGGRSYRLFTPSDVRDEKIYNLVVVLHGCQEGAYNIESRTGWNELAEEEKFIVLYPEQPITSNAQRCWNWFYSSGNSRGGSELVSIINQINMVKNEYKINRVFAHGFSSGGAMAQNLAAAYPDVIDAFGSSSGITYASATSAVMASYAMLYNITPSVSYMADEIVKEMGSRRRKMPAIIFHGTSDLIVSEPNGEKSAKAWAEANEVEFTTSSTKEIEGGRSYTHYVYEDEFNNSLVEYYKVDGMSHAWSGGKYALYSDPSGPDATTLSYEFFTKSTNKLEENKDKSPIDIEDEEPMGSVTYGSLGKEYRLYVPYNYDSNKEYDLVVALHACGQDADTLASITNWDLLADKNDLIILYPEQDYFSNIQYCWNWFYNSNQKRSGELQTIVNQVNMVKGKYNINKVFASGFSSGGALANNLGAAYPDVFDAISVISGLPYKSATSASAATSAMANGAPYLAEEIADNILYQMGHYRTMLPVFIIHGAKDGLVNLTNGHKSRDSWALANGLLNPNTKYIEVDNGYNYHKTNYYTDFGNLLLTYIEVEELAHAYSGGTKGNNYSDYNGPDASILSLEFFIESTKEVEEVVILEETANITNHYLSGRISEVEMFHLSRKYGYRDEITLYSIRGSNVWSDLNPIHFIF